MNCVKCGKPIIFIRTESERMMPVDERMVYVVPDEKSRLKAITRTGIMFGARVASSSDKDAIKAYMPHWASCKRHITAREQATRSEFDRRQDAVIDARIALQKKQYAARMTVMRTKAEEVEQLALF